MTKRGPGWTRLPGWLERRWWRVLVMGVVLGQIAALGQAPFNLWPATLLGLAGSYALLGAAPSLRKSALTGWAFGFGYFGLTLVWIVQPFLVEPDAYGWMAPFGLTFMAGGMALFWGLGFAIARWLSPAGRFGWLAFAAALGAMELVRATIFTGFPWGEPGLVWVNTPVAQLASLIGAFGLTVLTFAGGALIWRAVARRKPLPMLGVALGFGVAFGAGTLLNRTPIPDRATPVHLRLVQPNATQALKWEPEWMSVFLNRAVTLTKEPPAPDHPAADLVIWPETSVPARLGDYPSLQAELAATAAPARLIAGIIRLDGQRGYNSLVLFAADGTPELRYDKHHLVPFGEYTPLGDLAAKIGFYGLAAKDGYGYSAGPGAEVLHLPGALGTALPLICYEAIFPRDLRAAPERADWILQITNDGWFGNFSGPQQHLAQARFRAIEMGLPFVRAANTGISAVIDAHGAVLARLPLNQAGKLDADLPGALPPSVYAKYGNIPVVLLLIMAGAGLIVARRAKYVDRQGIEG